MDWSDYFIGMAKYISTKSHDSSTKVGAVIVDSKNRIVGTGFNGSPRGVLDASNREQKLMRTIHAEANALHFSVRDVEGCTIYVTHPPCAHCAGHLIQRGISCVVFPSPETGFLERWKDNYYEALAMFGEAGINVKEVSQ